MKHFTKALVYEFEGSDALSQLVRKYADETVVLKATDDYQDKINAEVLTGVECFVTDVFDNFYNEYFDLNTLKYVAVNFTSLSMFDEEFLAQHNIKTAQVTDHATPGVAETMLAMLLNLTRNIPEALEYAKGGGESFNHFKGSEIGSQKIAVYGMGSIGGYFANVCSDLGASITYTAQSQKEVSYDVAQFEELTADATVLAICVPKKDDTIGVFDRAMLDKLRSPAVILCPGQFECFIADDLYNYLNDNRESKFWLDVEATPAWNENKERFLELDNVYVTPHIAFFTHEQPARALRSTQQNLENWLTSRGSNDDLNVCP